MHSVSPLRLAFPIHVASLLLLMAGPCLARTWTDASGDQTVEAKFVTSQFGKIWLLRDDGKVFGIAAGELSETDRQFVQQQIRKRQADQAATDNPAGRVAYGAGRRLGVIENESVAESSGVACTRQRPGFFWTHNDSGGDARVYLFDRQGRDLGSCQLKDIFAYDFEDMFSFRADDKNYLVLCDVGNNGRAAPVQMLHVVEEPPFDPKKGLAVRQVPVVRTVYVSYEDDHRDCEAVAIDPTTQTILFISKERESECYAYALAMPETALAKAVTARRIATLKLPAVTAMDISPDGRRAIVLTYGHAYEFLRGEQEDWSRAFARAPRKIVVPERIQGESICYGPDGRTLFLTSEKRPTPLLTVPLVESPAATP